MFVQQFCMKRKSNGLKTETPIYELETFGAKTSSFYIQNFKEHLHQHPFVDKPHKHDSYLILFILKGKGTHTIDFTRHTVQANTLFLMTPGQVHAWDLSPDTDGFLIFFNAEFYQQQLSENSLLEFPFYHSLQASPRIVLQKNDAILFAFQKMLEEYTSSLTPNLRLLRAYLDVLLLEAARQYKADHTLKPFGNTFKLRKLEKLIEENFLTIKQPSEYAARMNLAPTYLNSICKQNLGKTLTELIQARVLLEAKRLFAYSDLHINEVAAKLHFTDVSYFIRWFKKSSGLTPEQFRKSQLL